MSIKKKQRDVKFIIYQSLYILIIALLGVNEVTIMNIPKPIHEGETKVRITELDSLKNRPELTDGQAVVDTTGKMILPADESKKLVPLDPKTQAIVSIDELNRLKNNQKTASDRVTQVKTQTNPVKKDEKSTEVRYEGEVE